MAGREGASAEGMEEIGNSYEYDFGGSEERAAFRAIPNGDYELEVSGARLTDGASGSGLLRLVLVLVGPERYKGIEVYEGISLSQAAAWKMRQFHKSLGEGTDRGTMCVEDLIGRGLVCRLALRMRSGYEDRIVVQRFLAPGSPTKKFG